MKIRKWIPVLCFGLLMLGLGSNDALRGIFAPVFQGRYGLNDSQLSWIVTASYVGNLLFLSIGGKLLDTFDRKTVMLSVIGLWMAAMGLNLVTDNYYCIVVSMFLALGASTLLNTAVNLMTPLVCAGYAGLMVNVFFFVQGIGTSGSQFLLGRYAFDYAGWRRTCLILLLIGAAAAGLLCLTRLSKETKPAGSSPENQTAPAHRADTSASVFWLLAAMIGCYFIAEHGIMNWLLAYCIQAFAMPADAASLSLSIFWGGMTVGRLVFAPVVQRMGAKKSLRLFGGAGTLLFAAGILLGEAGIYLLSLSGLAMSILYPTMILFIQELYPPSVVATRTGAVISAATIADILFNLLFGMMIDGIGYRMSFLVLPACMIGFYLLYGILSGRTKQE